MPDETVSVEKSLPQETARLAKAQSENVPTPRRRTPRSRGVTVGEDIIEPLTRSHEKLEGYIKGFILFQELCADSERVRSALLDQDRWKEIRKFDLLDEVRITLQRIQGSFVRRPIWEHEFADELGRFATALTQAQEYFNGDDFNDPAYDPDQRDVLGKLRVPITTMSNSANTIEGRCRTGADDEINELGRYVKAVFDQLQRKPKRPDATSGLNRPSPPLPQESADTQAVGEFILSSEEQNVHDAFPRKEARDGR